MMKTLIVLFLLLTQQAFAQTCRDTIQASAPDSRFTVNGTEVTDNQTGLIWQRCSIGQTGSDCSGGGATSHTWQAALQQAISGWRLPNIKELRSLVEVKCVSPAINLTIFPNTPASHYWSASPYADYSGNAGLAGLVNFGYGHPHGINKDDNGYVRLVRGGQ